MVANKNLFSSDIKEKVQSLISKMTLEEKVGQMSQFDWGFHAINPDAGGEINEIMKDLLDKGMLGSLFNLSGVEQANTIQQQAIERSRLGIPMIVGRDVIHGYRSVFPIPLAQSASWNPDLIRRTAAAASKEAASDGISWVFAPMIDITRDPRWGRIAETMGEDPHLGEIMAESWVEGSEVQDSTNESLSVASCPKHFAGYGFAESGRDYNTVDVSDRVLREVILPPFRKAVDAGALSMMASFNELNGIPACANRYLLTTILREEWGFEGVLVSDYNALGELIAHGVAKDAEEACEIAIKAGTDMDMHSGIYYKYLPKLVKEGRVDESLINSAVGRILALKMKLGLFDKAQVNPLLQERVILSEEHVSLAREAARESIVLLKNDNRTLPLSKQLKTLAIIGPLATNTNDPLGCWAADGNPDDVVSLLDGIKGKISPDTELLYAEGCAIESEDENSFEQALAVVAQADVTIIAVGESKTMSGEGNSRSELDLPGKQRELVEAVIKLGKPVIVVLFNGRPLTTVWLDETATAIIEAWHLGIQSGNAIADVLFGDYNPSGKLTATFPRSVGQIPLYYYRRNTGRPPGGVYSSRYIDAPVQALYPFGYGLSYTNFEYSNLVLSSTRISSSESVSVSVNITNTGSYKGEEVVQLYVRDVTASVTQPLKKLKGFMKISLDVGEMKMVTFTVTPSDLAIIGADNSLAVEAGSFQVMVGSNSEDGLIGEIVVV